MRNAVLAMILIVILVFAGFTVQSIHNKSIRKNELDTNLSAAIEESLSVLAIDPDYSAEGEGELLSAAIENLLTRVTSDSDFKVRVLAADAEKGLLDIEATEHFRQPGGKEASVTCRRTALLEDYKENEDIFCKVTFEIEGTIMKEIHVHKGGALSNDMLPSAPERQGKTFIGWRLPDNGAVYEDISGLFCVKDLSFQAVYG